MTNRISVFSSVLTFVFVLALAGLAAAQKPAAAPRQEKLLNGLKVLAWKAPETDKVTLKLRIHGGSAFDPQEREGVMKLLSESFFPTAESKSFFKEELDGSLEIVSTYDYIQINATAKSSEFLTLFETVAQAISTPDLGKEATAALKASLLSQLKEQEKEPAYIADRAAAKRLFGTFPYGRAQMGTSASVEKIDFADLIFLKDRLLTADNATLAVSGNVDPALVFRASRRYFGSWLKADKKIPSTFRQPDAPAAAAVEVTLPGILNSEVRYAVRGMARSSKDFAAAEVLSSILQSRFREAVAKSSGMDASVSHDEHILPGAFIFRYRSLPTPVLLTSPAGAGTAGTPLMTLYNRPAGEADFAAAKTEAITRLDRHDQIDLWLDVDTFKITSVADEQKAFQNVTLADVNALLQKLAREPLAIAVVAAPSPSPTN